MFIKTSEKIAKLLKKNKAINDESYELCQYGLQQGMSICLNLLTTIFIGIITGMTWQSIVITILFIPLRSNVGGFHAKTAVSCYISSAILMIIVLLAMKYFVVTKFAYIIIFLIAFFIIYLLSPVEDSNKPLDDIEKVTFRKRSIIVASLQCLLFALSFSFNFTELSYCFFWNFILVSSVLLVGKAKNIINKTN